MLRDISVKYLASVSYISLLFENRWPQQSFREENDNFSVFSSKQRLKYFNFFLSKVLKPDLSLQMKLLIKLFMRFLNCKKPYTKTQLGRKMRLYRGFFARGFVIKNKVLILTKIILRLPRNHFKGIS